MPSILGNLRACRPFVMGLSLAALLWTPSNSHALPANGTPAPPLKLPLLLQAPQNASANWAALRGKVVVLEFWATWCAPCVAAIPHLNRIVESLNPAKVQFISIDDEDPKVVRSFLTRKKMAGWVGIDSTGAVFKRYGIAQRPTTIVIDATGKIAGVTNVDALTSRDLQAVAAGGHPRFHSSSAEFANAMKTATSVDSASKPLLEISLARLPPDNGPTRGSMSMRSFGTGVEIRGASAEWLLTYVYRVESDRFEFASPLPDDRFDLRTNFPEAGESVTSPLLQDAVAAGLHLEVKPKTVNKSVYVLKATPAARELVKETASTRGSERDVENGNVKLVNVSMDGLASSLEDFLDVPVVNETGIPTHFDADLEFPSKEMAALNLRLLAALGVQLTREERPVEMLEVTPLPQKDASPEKPTPIGGSS